MKPGSGTSGGRSAMSAFSAAAKLSRKRTTPRNRVAGMPVRPKAVRPPLRASHCSWYRRICVVSIAGSSGAVAEVAMAEACAGAGG
jgi:hypothetical protein